MNTLQRKINYLELRVINDKARLYRQGNFLLQRLHRFTGSVTPVQILLGGFLIGFLLGWSHMIAKYIRPMTFVTTLQWIGYLVRAKLT